MISSGGYVGDTEMDFNWKVMCVIGNRVRTRKMFMFKLSRIRGHKIYCI